MYLTECAPADIHYYIEPVAAIRLATSIYLKILPDKGEHFIMIWGIWRFMDVTCNTCDDCRYINLVDTREIIKLVFDRFKVSPKSKTLPQYHR